MFVTSYKDRPPLIATSFDWCRNLKLSPSLVGIFCSPSIWEAEARGLPVNNLNTVLKVKRRKGKGFSLMVDCLPGM